MRSFFALLAIVLCVAYVYADCEDGAKDPEDGDVKSWFKNVGCTIKKGAGDLSESVKPLGEKISSTAKDVGSTIADKYDQLKHKLTDDNSEKPQALFVVENAPTEKVPLAPLNGEARAATA